MKPKMTDEGEAAGGGAKRQMLEPDDVEHRSALLTEDFRGSCCGRLPISNSHRRSYSKSNRSSRGRGSSHRVSGQMAERASTPAEGDMTAGGTMACAVLLSSNPPTSPVAAAAGDIVVPFSTCDSTRADMLQSTLLKLKTRKLPAGPLPKMDEVIARFMNISPKQWQLLNSTIDELNERFKQGALHWLLLRWLVAAHPEKFFPPPFNSYQQLLHQVAQKDAEVEKARKDAAKWRDVCVRLQAERERWKRQLQQMEEEVSGLYTTLAEQHDLMVSKEAGLKQQSAQQCSEAPRGTTESLRVPPQNEPFSRGQSQQLQEENHQSKHGQQQQRQCRSEQPHTHQEGRKQQRYKQDTQEHKDHNVKQHDALLWSQLAHPASSAQSANSCDHSDGYETVREEEKKDANVPNLPSATTTKKTKTTVTTTTKSSTHNSHSVSITKDTDPVLPSSKDTSGQQLRDTPTQTIQGTNAEGEVSLASILACMQNLLRRLTTEKHDSFVFPPSGASSPQESQHRDVSDCTLAPSEKQLYKRQGRKVQKKNVELWYLQYKQQNGPSAALEEERRKKKMQQHQDKRERDKKKKHHEQRKQQHLDGSDHHASKVDDEHEEHEEKHKHDMRSGMDNKIDDASAPCSTPISEAGTARAKGLVSQKCDAHEDDYEAEQQRANLSNDTSFSKLAACEASTANAAVSQPSPGAAAPSQFPPAYAKVHRNQETTPETAELRRFLALYEGGKHIPEPIAIRLYLEALKPDLKQYIEARHPATLAHAVVLAQCAERLAAGSAASVSSVRMATMNSSTHDLSEAQGALVKIPTWPATQEGDELVGENDSVSCREPRLKDCSLRAVAPCIKLECTPTGQDRRKTYVPANESNGNRENAGYQRQQQEDDMKGLHLQQHKERRTLQDFPDGDVWHSGEETLHSSGGAFVAPTVQTDLPQHQSTEEQQLQKVDTQQEKTYIIPRPGPAKPSTEKTHVIGRFSKAHTQCVLPRHS